MITVFDSNQKIFLEYVYLIKFVVNLIIFTTLRLIIDINLCYYHLMFFKKIIAVFLISILLTSCQTIKEKSDAIAEKENREYGKLVGKNITELKIELGNPTEDFINEIGNKVLIYKSKKYAIPCDRKFEVDKNNIIISFTSSGCI